VINYSSGLPGIGRLSVERLLETLNGLRLKSDQLGSSARPLLSLHLKGGGQLDGWLLDFGPADKDGTRGESVVVLHRAWPDVRQPAEAVAFVPLRDVQAVTVFEAPAAAQHFVPSLSRMDLRRLAEQSVQPAASKIGKPLEVRVETEAIPESAVELFAKALRAFRGAFSEIASDPLGEVALKSKVQSLRIAAGPKLMAKFEGSALAITLPTGDAEIPTNEELKTALESVL